MFAHALRDEGYDVDAASTATEAREQLNSGSPYARVIVDWWLPDGTGVVLANQAAALGAKTFVLSGYAVTLIGATADRHELLRKPMTPIKLIEAVHRKLSA